MTKGTIPYYSETNPVIGKINYIVITIARISLIESDLPKK
jgi:hypothetical protein